jgi:hypothetical protein
MPPRDETQPGWPAPAAFSPVGNRRRRIPPPRPRGRPVAMLASEPRTVFGIADFQELRRQGLFDDDGRNPPPSWWAR